MKVIKSVYVCVCVYDQDYDYIQTKSNFMFLRGCQVLTLLCANANAPPVTDHRCDSGITCMPKSTILCKSLKPPLISFILLGK